MMTDIQQMTNSPYYQSINQGIDAFVRRAHADEIESEVIRQCLEWALVLNQTNPLEPVQDFYVGSCAAMIQLRFVSEKFCAENLNGTNDFNPKKALQQLLIQKIQEYALQTLLNPLAATKRKEPEGETRSNLNLSISSSSSHGVVQQPKKAKLDYPSQLDPLVKEGLLTADFACTLMIESNMTINLFLDSSSLTLLKKKIITPQQLKRLKPLQIEEMVDFVEMGMISQLNERQFEAYLNVLKSPLKKELFSQGELALEQSQGVSDEVMRRIRNHVYQMALGVR